MSRTYIVFGSNDGGQTLAPVGTFEAADHDSAKKLARDAGYKEYGSCPLGNWSFGRVKEKVIIEVEEIQMTIPGQMTVDDVTAEIEKDKMADDGH